MTTSTTKSRCRYNLHTVRTKFMPFALYAVCRMSRVESGPSTSILRTWCRQRVSIALQPGRLDIPCMRLSLWLCLLWALSSTAVCSTLLFGATYCCCCWFRVVRSLILYKHFIVLRWGFVIFLDEIFHIQAFSRYWSPTLCVKNLPRQTVFFVGATTTRLKAHEVYCVINK